MKAMIFAAGLGSRLKPLTDTKPKALIEVAGKPMLEHVILKLKASGFNEIVINVHHFADQILDFLQANHNFGVDIHISDETEELLDTGGGLEKAGKYFISPCHEDKKGILLHNVDILSNCNLQDLIRFHQQTPDVYATMLVSRRITSRYLLFDGNNLLCGWINKTTGEVKPAGLKYEEGKYREPAIAEQRHETGEIFYYRFLPASLQKHQDSGLPCRQPTIDRYRKAGDAHQSRRISKSTIKGL